MAHLLVYVQRTPYGIHPGSQVGLSMARDIASTRGASVTAVCAGDGGEFDGHVERQVSRFGGDLLFFVGPSGIASVHRRLLPRHVIAPWTREAISTLGQAGLQGMTPRLIEGPGTDVNSLEPAVGVIAGTIPWRRCDPELVEAEYEGDVGDAPVPMWCTQGDGNLASGGGLVYVAPPDLDDASRAALERLGAHPAPPDYAASHQRGTLLWLDAGPAGLPMSLAGRPAHTRVIVLPGSVRQAHDSWNMADWVFPGPWPEVIATLEDAQWQAAVR
jgi:hypothetical protein